MHECWSEVCEVTSRTKSLVRLLFAELVNCKALMILDTRILLLILYYLWLVGQLCIICCSPDVILTVSGLTALNGIL